MKVTKYSATCISDHLYWDATFVLAWFTVWVIPYQFTTFAHDPSELDEMVCG